MNYQKLLYEKIEDLNKKNERPVLLLHTCCAPCSSYCLEVLAKPFKVNVFYYNPNITDSAEYGKRLVEQERLINTLNEENNLDIGFIPGEYNPDSFFTAVKGYEKCPEGGSRCEICFRQRLSMSRNVAIESGARYFTTSLTISPLKNATLINSIGEELSKESEVTYLNSDFKKNDGYKRSIELSKKYDLYRQDYCGCIFSKIEMENKRCKNLLTN